MDFLDIAFWTLNGFIVLRGAVHWWRDPLRVVRRRLAKVPPKPLGATRDGEWAHVQGLVLGRPTLTSPLTGRSCIGYRYVIDTGTKGASPLAQAGDCASFVLEADGFLASVEGPFEIGLDVAVVEHDARIGLRDVLKRARVPIWTEGEYKKLRAREALLSPDDRVALLGRVSLEVHPQGQRDSFRDQPIRRIIRGTSARPTLLATDVTPR
jgi:hypothetical protein